MLVVSFHRVELLTVDGLVEKTKDIFIFARTLVESYPIHRLLDLILPDDRFPASPVHRSLQTPKIIKLHLAQKVLLLRKEHTQVQLACFRTISAQQY